MRRHNESALYKRTKKRNFFNYIHPGLGISTFAYDLRPRRIDVTS